MALALGLAGAPCALGADADAGHAAGCAAPVAGILALADQRLALMRDVAAWKWQHHAAVTAPAREQAVIHQAAQLAGPLGLSPPAVAQLFALQVRLAREEETRLQSHWQGRGFDYRGPAPSLQAVLRPRLDRITSQQLMALRAAVPELARSDWVSQDSACSARALRAEGWSVAGRGALLADLHAIGVTASASAATVSATPSAAPVPVSVPTTP